VGNLFQEKVPAAVYVGNGFGKLVGTTQVEELGLLETPIVLTNTLSTFGAADAVIGFTLAQPGNEDVKSVNPVVGECNDGYLNDIRARRVGKTDVLRAIASAHGGPVEEGSVGAGTGTRCFGWKGGIGTASRVLPKPLGSFTVGVLVQTNFGGVLSVAGAPVGKELGRYYLKRDVESGDANEDGSCMVVVATDAPLDSRLLKRLAKRAILGLAAVGSAMTNGSGEYVIAFSTDKSLRSAHRSSQGTETGTLLRNDAASPLFQAVREATEEAVLNSLFKATTVTGHEGHSAEAIPIARVLEICRRFGAIRD
jgi:D-aminopeptidase